MKNTTKFLAALSLVAALAPHAKVKVPASIPDLESIAA